MPTDPATDPAEAPALAPFTPASILAYWLRRGPDLDGPAVSTNPHSTARERDAIIGACACRALPLTRYDELPHPYALALVAAVRVAVELATDEAAAGHAFIGEAERAFGAYLRRPDKYHRDDFEAALTRASLRYSSTLATLYAATQMLESEAPPETGV